jgi:hypothetical protein
MRMTELSTLSWPSTAPTGIAALPCNRPAEVIEILKTGLARLHLDRVDQVGNAVLDTEPRLRTAQIGAHPARGKEQQRPRIIPMAAKLRINVFSAALLPRYTS